MSSIIEIDATRLMSCPYNPVHLIMPRRFQRHLVKCARQHPHIKLEVCPFNASHKIKPENLSAHKIECPDRLAFERYMSEFEIGPWKKEKKDLIKFPEYKDDENWDDMVGQGGYDPMAATVTLPMCRKIIGATKKEKKIFYTIEQKRLQMLQDAADGKIVLKREDLFFATKIKEEPDTTGEPMERLSNYETESESETDSEIEQETKTEVGNVDQHSESMTVKTEFGYGMQEIVIPEQVKLENIQQRDIKQPNIKHETITIKEEKNIKKEELEIDDEICYLYEKRQRDLQNVIKNLQAKEPNALDPRLQISEDGIARDRSPSPIFKDLHSDPRLRLNPFSFMKGKENLRDPRLASQLKSERDNMRKIFEEEKLKEKQRILDEEKCKQEKILAERKLIQEKLEEENRRLKLSSEEILLDIDILDHLIDDVESSKPVETDETENSPEARKRSTSTCSAASKESGEISDHDSDVIVLDDEEDDLDALLNSADFLELKNCALAAKGHKGRNSEKSSKSSKRRDKSPVIIKESSSYLKEIEQLRKKIKQKKRNE